MANYITKHDSKYDHRTVYQIYLELIIQGILITKEKSEVRCEGILTPENMGEPIIVDITYILSFGHKKKPKHKCHKVRILHSHITTLS